MRFLFLERHGGYEDEAVIYMEAFKLVQTIFTTGHIVVDPLTDLDIDMSTLIDMIENAVEHTVGVLW